GFFRANAEVFDLVVLDLMLPGRSGLEILQALRQRRIDTPVLILTARDGIDDRVLGLDLGADDYLVKPFALPELLARVRALLRRGRPSDVFRLKAADLELDLVARRAVRGGRLLCLTARAFELLVYATATFLAVRHEFYEQFDDQLHDDFETAEGRLMAAADGRVVPVGDRHHDPDAEDRGTEVWSANGELTYRSDSTPTLPPIVPA